MFFALWEYEVAQKRKIPNTHHPLYYQQRAGLDGINGFRKFFVQDLFAYFLLNYFTDFVKIYFRITKAWAIRVLGFTQIKPFYGCGFLF